MRCSAHNAAARHFDDAQTNLRGRTEDWRRRRRCGKELHISRKTENNSRATRQSCRSALAQIVCLLLAKRRHALPSCGSTISSTRFQSARAVYWRHSDNFPNGSLTCRPSCAQHFILGKANRRRHVQIRACRPIAPDSQPSSLVFQKISHTASAAIVEVVWCNTFAPASQHPAHVHLGRFARREYIRGLIVESLGLLMSSHAGPTKPGLSRSGSTTDAG